MHGRRDKIILQMSDNSSSSAESDTPVYQAKKRKKFNREDSFALGEIILQNTNELLVLYEVYLKVLLGRLLNKADLLVLSQNWGVPQSGSEEHLLPDCVMKQNSVFIKSRFPNPDHPALEQYPQLNCVQAFDSIQKCFKLNTNLKGDLILLKAIEKVFLALTPYHSREWLNRSFNRKVIRDSNEPKISSPSDQQRQSKCLLIDSAQPNYGFDLLKSLVNQMQTRLIGSETLRKAKWQDAFDLEFKKIRQSKPKLMQKGAFHICRDGVWQRTENDTSDFLTLVRHITILLLNRTGFTVKQFISDEGRFIFLNLYCQEPNLKQIASKHEIRKRLNFWFTDLFTLEPVDKSYRPLRLNNRLWKPEEYEISHMLSYLRPMIIELLKSINFKKVSQEVNLNRLNQQLFKYGDKDLNDDDEGPTDAEWFAYYKYLVHLEKEIKIARSEYQIDNDVALLINKQAKPMDLYLIRNKDNPNFKDISKKVIKESKYHQNEIEKYHKQMMLYLNDFSSFLSGEPTTKAIKMLKQEKLGNRYCNIFKEALIVANTEEKILRTVWEVSNLEMFETYATYKLPNKSLSPNLQAKHCVCWCKYQVNENKKLSTFSGTERLKLCNLALCDIASLNELMSQKYISQIFCLNDHYELFGQAEFPLEPLTLEESFYQKKLYHLEFIWRFDFRQPWYIPYDEISRYYGEKIGLYFYYSSYFTEKLLVIALIGFGFNVVYWLIDDPSNPVMPLLNVIFPFVQIQWTGFLTEIWEQKQILFNLKNGMSAKDSEVQIERSNFKGTYKRSVENDQLNSIYVNETEYYLRVIVSGILMGLMVTLYGGIIVGLFMITLSLREALRDNFDIPKRLNMEVTITATINIIIITFLDNIYEFVSSNLTDFENQKSVADYENSIVVKKYILNFTSYISPLIILNFLSSILNLYCQETSCEAHVQYHFATIIVWIFFFKSLKIIRLIFKMKNIPIFKYNAEERRINEFVQEQALRESYAKSQERYGTMEDYMEVFIFNTLLSIFGYSFPFSFMFVWLQNLVQLQADKVKFLYCLQRPWPQNTASLGVWHILLQFINYVCILTNTGQMAVVYNKVYQEQFYLVYLSFFIFNFFSKFIINAIFGQIPFELSLMIQRQKYILKSTIEQFAKNKQSSSSDKQEVLKRFPIAKLYGVALTWGLAHFETISSQSVLEDYYIFENKKPSNFQQISNQSKKLQLDVLQNKLKGLPKQLIDPPADILKSRFQSRPVNWAFEVRSWVKKHKMRLVESQRLMHKLQLLDNHKNLWTDLRLNQRHLYLRRKKVFLRDLDARRLGMFIANLKKMREYYTKQADLKFRKQFKLMDPNSTKPDDIKEYQALVEKQSKYIEKHTLVSSRKIIVLKIKGTWFWAFRKQTQRMPAKKVAMETYLKSQAADRATQNKGLQNQFLKLVENQRTVEFSFEEFCSSISKLEFSKQKNTVKMPLSCAEMNHAYYLFSEKKSPVFINIVDKFKDTYIFDDQIQKLQEYMMQYFEEELFTIPIFVLNKQMSDNVWQATNEQKENVILQFHQIKHGQSLSFQTKSKVNLGVSYAESVNFIRLANLVDQIDDFSIKGYSIQVYKYAGSYTLRQVIKHRKTYSIEYTVDEIRQFTQANLKLFKERPYGNLSTQSYLLCQREYILLNSNTPNPDVTNDIFSLACILMEMIDLVTIEDPVRYYEGMGYHPLKGMIREMIYDNPTVDSLLKLLGEQQKFVEMVLDLPQQKPQKGIDIEDFTQLMTHRINFTFRLKQFDQTLKYVAEVEEQFAQFYFQQSSDFIQKYTEYLSENIFTVIVKPNQLELLSSVILIQYFKVAAFIQKFQQKQFQGLELLQELINVVHQQLDLILRELRLNMDLQNVSIVQRNTLLKRRNTTSYQDIKKMKLHQQLIDFLRANPSYIKVIHLYDIKLERFQNQFNTLKSIDLYFQKNFNLASVMVSNIIETEIELITKEPAPSVKPYLRDVSPSQVNFDQTSPLEESNQPAVETVGFFRIEDHIKRVPDYCYQLIYYKYLQLVFWFDERNELFIQHFLDYLQIPLEGSPILKFFQHQLQALTESQMMAEYLKQEQTCEIGRYIVVKIKKWLEQVYWQPSDIEPTNDIQYMFSQIMRFSQIRCSFINRGIIRKVMAISNHGVLKVVPPPPVPKAQAKENGNDKGKDKNKENDNEKAKDNEKQQEDKHSAQQKSHHTEKDEIIEDDSMDELENQKSSSRSNKEIQNSIRALMDQKSAASIAPSPLKGLDSDQSIKNSERNSRQPSTRKLPIGSQPTSELKSSRPHSKRTSLIRMPTVHLQRVKSIEHKYGKAFKLEIVVGLIKIRAIHHYLHMENFQLFSLPIYAVDFTQLKDLEPEYNSLIEGLRDLHQNLQQPLRQKSEILQHPGIRAFMLYHYLSVCFTFSPRQFESILDPKENVKGKLLVDLSKEQISNFSLQKEFYPQIMKKSQLLKQNEQKLLVDESIFLNKFSLSTISHLYQCLMSFFQISQYRNYNLIEYYNQVKDALINDVQPAIMILGIIQFQIQCQFNDMAELLMIFASQLYSSKADLFSNAYKEFDNDVIIVKSMMSKQYAVISPYDHLYKKKAQFHIEGATLELKCRVLFYQLLHHQHVEESLEYLQDVLPMLKENPQMARINHMFQLFKVLLKAYIAELDVEAQQTLLEFKVTAHSYFEVITAHLLARYYIHTKDFELAFYHSQKIINFLYSSDLKNFILINQTKFRQAFKYNQSEFSHFENVRYVNIAEEDDDYMFINIIDETFKCEAILNHLDILLNLQLDIPHMSFVIGLFFLVKTPYQIGYLFKIIAQLFLIYSSDNNLMTLRIQMLEDVNQKQLKVHREKKRCKRKQLALVQMKKYTADDAKQHELEMSVLNFLGSIYDSICVTEVNERLVLNWAIQAAEKSNQILRQMMLPFRRNTHYLVPENYLTLTQTFQNLKNLIIAKTQIANAEAELFEVYEGKKSPVLGYFFYIQGFYRIWQKSIFDEFLTTLSKTKLSALAIRQLQILMIQENSVLFQIILDQDQYSEEVLEQILLPLVDDKLLQTQSISLNQILAIFEDTCTNMSTFDFNGISNFTDAYSIFTYFNQNNRLTNQISELLIKNTQKRQQVHD